MRVQLDELDGDQINDQVLTVEVVGDHVFFYISTRSEDTEGEAHYDHIASIDVRGEELRDALEILWQADARDAARVIRTILVEKSEVDKRDKQD